MDKTCIINPATGRAVKIDGRLGKKLVKQKADNKKDYKKAMGDDYAKEKFGKMTEKELKQHREKVKKIKEEKNKKILGDKTAKDVFKIVKDYLNVWNYANYKKSKLDKRSYLLNHQDAWGEVYDIVDAYGEEKLRKTLNEKDKKILDKFNSQAKMKGTLEQEIMLN